MNRRSSQGTVNLCVWVCACVHILLYSTRILKHIRSELSALLSSILPHTKNVWTSSKNTHFSLILSLLFFFSPLLSLSLFYIQFATNFLFLFLFSFYFFSIKWISFLTTCLLIRAVLSMRFVTISLYDIVWYIYVALMRCSKA